MSQTVADLIQGKEFQTVQSTMSVREALAIMEDRDYSQLPVIDANGRLAGLFTERNVTRALNSDLGCDILDFTVGQWMESAPLLVSPTLMLHQVASMLKDTYAVIVGEHGLPIGIVTDWDIANFLSEWSYGIALVEDIEKQLRQFIEDVFPTKNERDAALYRALGSDKQDRALPAKQYDELNLYQHLQVIIAQKNWTQFAHYLGHSLGKEGDGKEAFRKLIEEVIRIRDQVTHFRGRLTKQQISRLEQANMYLANCPRVQETKPFDTFSVREERDF